MLILREMVDIPGLVGYNRNRLVSSFYRNRVKKIRKRNLIIIILVLIFGVVGWLFYSQWDNLKALQTAQKYTDEELAAMQEENQQVVKDILDKLPEVSGIEMTQDVREKIQNGELSEEEAISAIIGTGGSQGTETASDPESQAEDSMQDSDAVTQPSTQDPTGTAVDQEMQKAKDRIAELVAKVYVLEASYTSQLGQMESSAISEYKNLPKEERTKAKQLSIAMGYLNQISAMESSCDSQMEEIVSELRELLKTTGGDETIPDDIMAAYKNEKEVQKAQYISKYSKYLQ